MSMTPTPLEIALQRIEACRRTRSTKLDLSKLGLETIPEAVFDLTWLEKLDVSGDKKRGRRGNIREIPEAIERLRELSDFAFVLNEISDLSPLAHVPNLTSLYCWSNQISDLSPLAHVPNLTSLYCWNNQISDLSPLAHVPNLTSLDCSRNRISDLSQLAHVPNLTSLSCWNNQISDLSPLAHVPNLTSLDCGNNQISDLSPLAHVPNLTSLSCGGNKISDLSPLAHVPDLTSLSCDGNKISDLSPLAHVPNLTSLSCLNNQISDLSPLSGLPALQSLDCRSNQISDLSPLKRMTALATLDCSFNQLSDLSPLKELSALFKLDCHFNQVSDLYPLKELKLLAELDCSSNQISDLSPLKELTALAELNCSSNQISDLSPLKELMALTELNCSSNQISGLLPLKELTALAELSCGNNQINDLSPIYRLTISEQLKRLVLASNPVYGIPTGIYYGDKFRASLFGYNCSTSLRNYWQDLAKGSEKQRQLKVQFVGNGRVGKTTLAYALEHNHQPPSEPFKSTHGITIKEIQQRLYSLDAPVTLQLWDFGGQEIYHATHRLFLSDDCLYLLLWAEDAEEKEQHEIPHPVSYWLESIHDLGKNSPVIVVKNQIDRADTQPAMPHNLDADMPGVPQIRQAVKVSAMKFRDIPVLRGAIESVIEELNYRVCLELPTSWLEVQHELEKLRPQKTIPFAHFKQLCSKAGVSHAEWFVGYLHKTGVLFYQENAFQDQIILDQNWVIEAVYQAFDPKGYRGLIEQMRGKFKGSFARIVWPDVDEAERQIYVRFMQNCHICYEAGNQDNIPFAEREFTIPALLPDTITSKKLWGNPHPDDWQLDVEYAFLHRSIIERLIVRLGATYQGDAWRTGIVCDTEYGQVLLERHYQDEKQSTQGSLSFQLRGSQLEPLVYALRKLVREVSPHQRYREYLTKAQTERQELPVFQDEETQHRSQLDPVKPNKTIKLFISYSRTDKEHKSTLEKHLRLIKEALKSRVNLEIWSDYMMDAGEGVNDQILPELRSADLIALVVSPDFLDPDRYSCRVELPIALERFEKEKIPVIPIIVRTTSWQEKLGHLTVPTKENADPLSKWPDKDEFWGSVEKGIRGQVEKLLRA